jgi:RNase H-like domain found in reverse transcriptase/Integrase zinc binding domain/Reverse transcriptase (RNA-dependent DNA polymerase)/Integrase core domain
VATLQHIPPSSDSLAGPGADEPDVKPLLEEFSDVLVSEIPGGLPPERFARDGRPIECCIDTEPDVKPYARPPKPFTAEETEEIKKYLNDFLSKGWIVPSLSPWAAPVLFVPKKVDPVTKQRSWRMCISYVKLNSKTLNRIAYRLPRIADLLSKVSRSRLFSKFDLLSGFYQIRMRVSDIAKTGFSTPFGNFEFRVMPMGLCGAPGTFQHLMDDSFATPIVLNGRTYSFLDFLGLYLDDICVHSETRSEHLLHLRAVLTRLRERKLYAKPTKCEWMRTTIEFLGHTVGPNGLCIASNKIDALQQWPAPKSVSELRSLLGTFGFWRVYIRNYAALTQPLVLLTRKDVAWHWGEREEEALEQLKRAIRESPILMPPQESKPYFVVTDSSDYAVGVSLEQMDEATGKRRPIAYFSHLLSSAECSYPTHERELLAIVLALRTWRQYLLGSEFSVISQTDHRPLQAFLHQTNLSARQVRWQQFLSEFNLQVTYLPGKANIFADGLSRVRLRIIAALAPYDGWLSRINVAVTHCPVAGGLKRKALNLDPKSNADAYVIHHGVLYWRANGVLRVYVPSSLRIDLIREFHDIPIAGHLGWRKCYQAMAQHYYWPGMPDGVREYVTHCPVCQRTKQTNQPKPPLRPLPAPARPFQHITLDWISGFPTDRRRKNSLLHIVDRFSKWVISIPCTKTMNTAQLCDVLYKEVFSWVGLPESITGDRDSRLTASQMRALLKFLNIKLKLSVAYHPQTDGTTERFHSTMLQMLRAFVNSTQRDWSEHVPALLYAYHNTVHTATGFTPHMLLFGWNPRDLRAPLYSGENADPDMCSGDADVDEWLRTRAHALRKAQVSLENAREAMIRAQKASDKAHVYKAGDLVKISTNALPLHLDSTQKPKLMPKYIGPLLVVSVSDKVVQVQLPASYSQVHDKFNVIDVRPWLHTDRSLDVSYPAVEPHPALNPIVQLLDRKPYGRRPRGLASYLDIPCTYFVVRKDQSTDWVRNHTLTEPNEVQLVKQFEKRFPRSEELPCNPVRDYEAVLDVHELNKRIANLEAGVSDDELDIAAHVAVDEYYGTPEA